MLFYCYYLQVTIGLLLLYCYYYIFYYYKHITLFLSYMILKGSITSLLNIQNSELVHIVRISTYIPLEIRVYSIFCMNKLVKFIKI